MTLPSVIAENIVTVFVLCQVLHWLMHKLRFYQRNYVGNSITKLQIQVTTYVFELSAGNCYR